MLHVQSTARALAPERSAPADDVSAPSFHEHGECREDITVERLRTRRTCLRGSPSGSASFEEVVTSCIAGCVCRKAFCCTARAAGGAADTACSYCRLLQAPVCVEQYACKTHSPSGSGLPSFCLGVEELPKGQPGQPLPGKECIETAQ